VVFYSKEDLRQIRREIKQNKLEALEMFPDELSNLDTKCRSIGCTQVTMEYNVEKHSLRFKFDYEITELPTPQTKPTPTLQSSFMYSSPFSIIIPN
jgi:hypothetical protein